MSDYFHEPVFGTDLDTAWRELVDQENEGFQTGDIYGPRQFSRTTSVRPHPTITEPLPEDEAEQFMMERAELLAPGEAEGIPVFEVIQPRKRRAGDLYLQVPVDSTRRNERDYIREQILKSVPEDWFSQLGRLAQNWENPPEKLGPENILFWRSSREAQDTHQATVLTLGLEPEIGTETRYVLVDMEDGKFVSPLTWENSFPTAHDALASAPVEFPEDPYQLGPQEVTYGVVGLVMRPDGTPLASRTLCPHTSVLSLKVSIGYQMHPREVTKETGWLIYGLAL